MSDGREVEKGNCSIFSFLHPLFSILFPIYHLIIERRIIIRGEVGKEGISEGWRKPPFTSFGLVSVELDRGSPTFPLLIHAKLFNSYQLSGPSSIDAQGTESWYRANPIAGRGIEMNRSLYHRALSLPVFDLGTGIDIFFSFLSLPAAPSNNSRKIISSGLMKCKCALSSATWRVLVGHDGYEGKAELHKMCFKHV